MNVLVLSAHPDDETIGAGGTLARLAARDAKVHLWVATEIYEPLWPGGQKPPRRAEAERAASILGVTDVRFGGLPTMNLATMPAIELAGLVGRLVEEFRPDILLAPPPADVNSDHSAVFDAALVAARGLPGSPVRAFYAYEIATTTRFDGPAAAFRANTYVDITSTFAKKLEAFAAYQSEKRDSPHPRSPEGLEILAKERGLGCGAAYAECFMLVSRRLLGEEAPAL